jgi:DNA polymerase
MRPPRSTEKAVSRSGGRDRPPATPVSRSGGRDRPPATPVSRSGGRDRPPARDVTVPVPVRLTLAGLRSAVQRCRACELWAGATQAVLGEGPTPADAMLVGEQPGDREDLEGTPFVGPAGRMLDRGLADAGIDPGRVYVTNVVKHFRYRLKGKRRIHQKPDAVHIAACRPWLDAELALVRPRVLVCLGATAAQALVGRDVRVTRDHGRPLDSALAPYVIATVHPSSLLRAPDEAARREAYAAFVEDLSAVAALLDERS